MIPPMAQRDRNATVVVGATGSIPRTGWRKGAEERVAPPQLLAKKNTPS